MPKTIYPVFAALLLIFSFNSQAQTDSRIGVLIKGQVKNDQQKSIGLSIDNGLLDLTQDSITINPSGRFQKWIPSPLASTGHISLVYGNDQLELYYSKSDTLALQWDGKDFINTVQVTDKKDVLNKFLIGQHKTFNHIRDQMESDLDSCKNFDFVINRVEILNKSEFEYLENNGALLDSLQYQKCAYDIYYRNMDLIVSSKFFGSYDFSNERSMFNFPPIALFDKNFDKIWHPLYEMNLKVNKDTTMAKRFSRHNAVQIFKTKYSLIDTAAFNSSLEYRKFIYTYFGKLASGISHRKLGKNIGPVSNYAQWLHSMIEKREIVDWLLACKIQYNISLKGANITKDQLEQDLDLIGSDDLRNILSGYFNVFNKLRPGMPAPLFSFLDQNNKNISLESYKGKYVYINFWSSSCGPCIMDITHYGKPVADKYAGKNILFLYISLDANDKEWQASVKKYNPPGINGRLINGWDNQAAIDYWIRAIPRHVIIHPDGTIADAQAPGLNSILYFDLLKL